MDDERGLRTTIHTGQLGVISRSIFNFGSIKQAEKSEKSFSNNTKW